MIDAIIYILETIGLFMVAALVLSALVTFIILCTKNDDILFSDDDEEDAYARHINDKFGKSK